jgi:predicted permease
MGPLIQDLRYAVRSLLRQPSFALTAILTLALGIGATTAIFSVVHAVLLKPLAFAEPERVVVVTNYWTRTGLVGSTVSAPDFHDWKRQSRSFSALSYYTGSESSISVNGSADYAFTYLVTPEFFDVLGIRARAGRLPTAEEFAPGGPFAAVITHEFAERQFGQGAGALGSTIKYADRVFTIVGILPPGARHPGTAEIYVPSWIRSETPSRSGHNYRVVGRLADGVTIEQADAEMKTIAAALEQQFPDSNAGKLAAVTSLHERLVEPTRATLYLLLGAVGLVLLIACANVANLLLARATAREREMVVRAAVGASRGRLVRQLLTESAVLGVTAGLLGVWFARFGVLALIATAPSTIPRVAEVRVDGTVLLFAMVVALLASIVFGLAPAVQVSRVQLSDGMRQGGKGSSLGARGAWARNAFVVAEVALAVTLVAGAGLLARSLAALATVDMGFTSQQLVVLRTQVPIRSVEEAPRATAFYRDVLAEMRAVPGVAAVGGVTSLPTLVRSNGGYAIEGRGELGKTGVRLPQALLTVVTPDYFRTLGVPLARGRDFNDGDRRDANFVAIINESLARASFPDEDPIGRRIQCGLDSLEWMTIVGVVRDVRTSGPGQPAAPELYMPYEQHPGPASSLNIVARTAAADPSTVVQTLERKIRERNPEVPVRVSTMDGTLETATAGPRFQTYLLVMFGSVALILALAGIYGVMSYAVSQRTSELGLRVALGATPGSIMRLVLGQGAVLAGLGLAAGVALALVSGRFLEGQLFGVQARDPLTLAAVTIVVAIASLAACLIPSRRAVRVDPMVALRSE